MTTVTISSCSQPVKCEHITFETNANTMIPRIGEKVRFKMNVGAQSVYVLSKVVDITHYFHDGTIEIYCE